MRWTPGGRSDNVEDRRGGGGGLGGGGRLGLGGVVVLLVLSVVFKKDFFSLVGAGGAGAAPSEAAAPVTDPNEEPMVQFVSFVLDDTQKTWTTILPQYQDAKLVLFRDVVQSGCGVAESATGPFYCPADHKVYIDLGFYQELKERFGAPGDFAQAYVLAHEIGHHVQNLLGTDAQMRRAQQSRPEQANALSVRLELQADCYAGVWGHAAAARNVLEPGDADEALGAAASIGDDRLQRMAGRAASPESFTHGTSAQRVAWFRKGFETGRPDACDTFRSAD